MPAVSSTKNTYKVSGGLHGVGVSCVCALSKKMVVQVFKNGKIHEMEFCQGVCRQSPLRSSGTTKTRNQDHLLARRDDHDATDFDYDILAKRLRELAFLNKGINIYFQR